jgi:hypothetical protein
MIALPIEKFNAHYRRLMLIHFERYTPKVLPEQDFAWPRELSVKGAAERLMLPRLTSYTWIKKLRREGLIELAGRGRFGNDVRTGMVFVITTKGRVEAAKDREIIIGR